ncbi:hypothetical protein [Bradyrhizobium sp. S3.9.1]|jgi:hypothetical protein|uniref:hypothetical protein n=1 Tax=Bradyrhizobium sp. S3.9.1 TaxID=3156431 RepID=UPI003392B4E2
MSDIDVDQGRVGLCVNSVEHYPCFLPPVTAILIQINQLRDTRAKTRDRLGWGD